ncbi:MAG TPA: carboxypeptidase-like regulatory domain-containing protein [Kofleriaceae bacterium]|nr:carboxypeptidase-like regulatory domain-containing protein [Kofleriaceae bacterium]
MTKLHLVLASLLVLAGTAAADDAQVTGFVTNGTGELGGTVTTRSGAPLANVQVHIVSHAGDEQVVTTDKQGRYQAKLAGGEYSLVFVHGDVRIAGHALVPATGADSEVVEIHEALPPAVLPKPKSNPATIPEYSDAAIDRDAWTRAWLMLDISETGKVTRVKLVRQPGYELDAIAVREAFKLEFEPARDRANRPTRALMLWTFEWPSYWWLMRQHAGMKRLPAAVAGVDCRESETKRAHDVRRDCSHPDMTKVISRPWLRRP